MTGPVIAKSSRNPQVGLAVLTIARLLTISGVLGAIMDFSARMALQRRRLPRKLAIQQCAEAPVIASLKDDLGDPHAGLLSPFVRPGGRTRLPRSLRFEAALVRANTRRSESVQRPLARNFA